LRPTVATLCDVVGDTLKDRASQTRHTATVAPRGAN
jgi:hypothetical protein